MEPLLQELVNIVRALMIIGLMVLGSCAASLFMIHSRLCDIKRILERDVLPK